MISFGFVAKYFNELEADFQREYGIDLRDALYGEHPMGLRRLSALIEGLSPDSATFRMMHTGGQRWGAVEELLATLCELIDRQTRLFYQANFDTKKGAKVWDAIEVPRPYHEGPQRRSRRSTPSEVQAFFTNGEFGVSIWDPTDSPPLPITEQTEDEVTE